MSDTKEDLEQIVRVFIIIPEGNFDIRLRREIQDFIVLIFHAQPEVELDKSKIEFEFGPNSGIYGIRVLWRTNDGPGRTVEWESTINEEIARKLEETFQHYDYPHGIEGIVDSNVVRKGHRTAMFKT